MEESKSQSASMHNEVSHLIRYHALGAAFVGMVPMPVFDMALLAGIQVNLVRSLAKIYELPFSDEVGKSAITALLGASVPAVAWSVGTFVPIVGPMSRSVLGAAITYAVGKVFVQHFESGGTFLTFDPKKVKEHFAQEMRKAAADEAKRVPNDTYAEEDYGGIKP